MTKDRCSQIMVSLKKEFIGGALNKGHTPELAEEVFARVAAFASFGFCKAHAASFAHITYQSAFLKAHYPGAFYVGLLNAGHVGSYPAWVILNEARRKGIPIYGPHVNSSKPEYFLEGSCIRVPLTAVNGIGPAIARRIVSERQRRGPFSCTQDFITRFSPSETILTILSCAGALDGVDKEWILSQEVCRECM
jgi:DNA polymerase III alpha subunit